MSRGAGARIRNGAWLTVAVYLIVAVAWKWPSWWTWIAPEAAPSRELSTMLLLGCAAVALIRARSVFGARPSFGARWLCLAAGFVVLAADERVAIHERLRDRLLAPNGIDLPFVPWAQPGDIVLVVVALVGLAMAPWLYTVFRGAEARAWFVSAIVLAATAVGLDTLPIESYSIAAERLLQTGEEITELAAATSFLSAVLSARMEEVVIVSEPQPPAVPTSSVPRRLQNDDRSPVAH